MPAYNFFHFFHLTFESFFLFLLLWLNKNIHPMIKLWSNLFLGLDFANGIIIIRNDNFEWHFFLSNKFVFFLLEIFVEIVSNETYDDDKMEAKNNYILRMILFFSKNQNKKKSWNNKPSSSTTTNIMTSSSSRKDLKSNLFSGHCRRWTWI